MQSHAKSVFPLFALTCGFIAILEYAFYQSPLHLHVLAVAAIALSSAAFLAYGFIGGSMRITHLTCVLSMAFVLEFGIAPLYSVFSGEEIADVDLLRAFGIVLIGSLSFWIACALLMRRVDSTVFTPFRPVPLAESRLRRIATLLFLISLSAKAFLISQGMFAYMADQMLRATARSYIQYVLILANFSYTALLLLAIEYFTSTTPARITRILFWTVFGINTALGILSGMKEEALINGMLVVVIWQAITGKSAKAWVVASLVLLLLIYPVNNAYRTQVRNTSGVRSVFESADMLSNAVNEGLLSDLTVDNLQRSVEATMWRLNLLSPVRFMVSCPDTELDYVRGESRPYMLLYLPLIPSALWAEKPVVNRGQRLTEAISGYSDSSTAVTIFGDLYLDGGYLGVVIGMFVLGLLIQVLNNMVIGKFDAKQLFIYASLFRISWKPEWDALTFWGSWIHEIPFVLLIGYAVFGGKLYPSLLNTPLGMIKRGSRNVAFASPRQARD